jgi:hypothetical protein
MINNHSPSIAIPEKPDNPAAISPPLCSPDTPADYNPAEYRWVPVRRRPRYDGWTEEKQRRFIEVLADTGIVIAAAKAVGMSRESANRLRRSPHAAEFARAWDAARLHAGSALEDIAFERAIEGVELNVYNECGEVICTKRVYNDRLLTFLLRHLKPERYARDAASARVLEASDRAALAPPVDDVAACLRAMEPQLPAPAEEILDSEELEQALNIADAADGVLPHFLSEQYPVKSAAQMAADKIAEQEARGNAVLDRLTNKDRDKKITLSHQDMVDITRTLDPASRNEAPRKRFR